MKKIALLIILIASIVRFDASAQEPNTGEKFGHTLNLGLGIGYYGYLGHPIPVFNINYEFDVVKNFTLAPTISIYKYTNSYYWGNKNYPYRNYAYSELVIPIGVKGTYYFDQLLKASSKWDFYLAASTGFVLVNSTWENGYYGDKDFYHRRNPMFIDLHIGAQYQINNHLGAYLDLSSGMSTIGLAIH